MSQVLTRTAQHNGSSISNSVYITVSHVDNAALRGATTDSQPVLQRPVTSLYPEDDCFDLQTVVRVQMDTDSPPRPRWVLRKNMVLFDSE